ncbi:MAG: hypothetical protein CO106_11270 [Deltaproteobacteria bacterium CG_4_9_14_3_um_filter_44_9]|nr:MAG: hypothetical protein CO106_11270 [Deltaproteobacteria bacterium CG_4_9_14_3_um_filter_44_9]
MNTQSSHILFALSAAILVHSLSSFFSFLKMTCHTEGLKYIVVKNMSVDYKSFYNGSLGYDMKKIMGWIDNLNRYCIEPQKNPLGCGFEQQLVIFLCITMDVGVYRTI